MKHHFYVLLFFALAIIGFQACQSEKPSSHDLAGSTYTGVIPCADCQGIAYRLQLKNDHRFETRSVYIGRSNRPFTEHGRWQQKEDSLIVLRSGDKDVRKFKIKDHQLLMLNQKGKAVQGSLAKMYMLDKKDSTASGKQAMQNQRKKGTDFHATGNEPSWSLDIDFDKKMKFKTLNGDSIQTPVPQMKKDSASTARLLYASVEQGSLKVSLSPVGCVDDMSGKVFSHQVAVTYGDKTFNGCGRFINPTYKLNDFWKLKTLNGQNFEKPGGPDQSPTLQFDVANEKVYGSTGCNRLNGNVSLQDSSLSFSKMATTRRACPGSMQLESDFTKALQKVDAYQVANAQLILKNKGDTLMVFRRAE